MFLCARCSFWFEQDDLAFQDSTQPLLCVRCWVKLTELPEHKMPKSLRYELIALMKDLLNG